MAESSRFKTNYENEKSGRVIFSVNKDAAEVDKYLELIHELKKSKELDKAVHPALDEIKFKLESLKLSDLPGAELKKKLKNYTRVPLGEGKFLHLSSFLSSTGDAKVVKSTEEYLAQVEKMIKNTTANLANLMIFKKEDEHLSAFFEELKALKADKEYNSVKSKMDHLTMSGIIKHYNDVKISFLNDWLSPFQEKLNKPIEKMTPEELQSALSQVDSLKKKELEEIGLRITPEASTDFTAYNKTMHELMNGKNNDFWGFSENRDEFMDLLQKTINRFSFKLENHYLIFELADKSLAYLVGFPNDAFESSKKISTGDIGLTPHLKVFFRQADGTYKEISKENMPNTSDYYAALRTAVVPFLASIAMILGVELSQGLKDAFDMWL